MKYCSVFCLMCLSALVAFACGKAPAPASAADVSVSNAPAVEETDAASQDEIEDGEDGSLEETTSAMDSGSGDGEELENADIYGSQSEAEDDGAGDGGVQYQEDDASNRF